MTTFKLGLILTFAAVSFDAVDSLADEERRLAPWLTDAATAYRTALENKQPILVRVGGESCAWCKRLEREIEKEEVQSALTAWTLWHIDIDKSPDEAQRLNVGAIPALRVLTPHGRLVQWHDGYLEAAELVSWINEQYEKAVAPADGALLSDHEPSLLEVVRVVRQFENRDARLREAAIRRLLPFPKTAGGAVVNALKDDKLSSRLVAYELLMEWKAPLESVDPWRPETLTDERFQALEDWLQEIEALPAPGAPVKLTQEQQQTARLEIEQMLKADPAEAAALRERLARRGRGLLPVVRERIQSAVTDHERERLVALRYRLVADDSLALTWPGGLERLADMSPAVRHKAAEELAARANSQSEALLLELFSDPDPLVREISLRGLQRVEGERATSALVGLLNDPEPNVRAAVLKQFTEDASPEMLSEVADYVEKEQDADLIVHAIRYFRETGSAKAVSTLLDLVDHQSWQVRAEAAEALGKILKKSRYSSGYGGEDRSLEIYDALLERLEDSDAFVVSRALDGLENVDARRAVAPLVRAAAAHPTLAPQVVDILAQGSQMREDAIPRLREFFADEDPAVRGAAIRGLCKTDAENVQGELFSAVQDEHTLVRTSAATSLLELFETLRPQRNDSWDPFSEAPLASTIGSDEAASRDPLEDWLNEIYSGKHRGEWTADLVAPFQRMLSAEEDKERLAAALVLIPLGAVDDGLEALLAVSREDPSLASEAAQALPWLVWQRRAETFQRLMELAQNDDARVAIVYAMNKAPNEQAAELYWQAVDRPDATQYLAQAVQSGLTQSYFGSTYFDASRITTRTRERVAAAVAKQLVSGAPFKRLVAVDLLLKIAPDQALKEARQLMNDPDVDPSLRSDAFQIALAAQAEPQREIAAIESLSSPDARRRFVSLKFLALGSHSLAKLPATGFTIDVEDAYASYNSGLPIIPEAPRRLEVKHVRPLVSESDPQAAAFAGYLLALLGEPEGLAPLLAYWRSQEPSDELDRLVYRAVAVLNDPQHVPLLRQIYARLEEQDKSEFYWTIRIMSGLEILSFRKQIREEVGMSNLR